MPGTLLDPINQIRLTPGVCMVRRITGYVSEVSVISALYVMISRSPDEATVLRTQP